jgi:hypothetical protein
MARVYTDEDFPGPAARRLRELGHDVLTIREAGYADRQVADNEVPTTRTTLRWQHASTRRCARMSRWPPN